MPDRLDDVEGFFGLEEVEGVEVERDGDGAVEFKVCVCFNACVFLFLGLELMVGIYVLGCRRREGEEGEEREEEGPGRTNGGGAGCD